MARVYTKSRIAFLTFDYLLLAVVGFVTILPFILIIASSLSGLGPILRNEVLLWPKEFTFDGYIDIIADGQILKAYYNTLWYTIVGVFVSLLMTMAAAYPLSRKAYSIRSPLMIFITITMFFSGGLIPSYILIKQLGLYNTRWVMVIPGAVSAYNLVMARVFLQTNVPEDMSEAAKIDGANDIQVFFRIALPLSKAIIAVLALYYGVGKWNDYFGPMIYLKDAKYMPLAMYLRQILISGTQNMNFSTPGMADILLDPGKVIATKERIKYASIIVTMVPIMCIYPFLQKYFAKGVMLGALKE